MKARKDNKGGIEIKMDKKIIKLKLTEEEAEKFKEAIEKVDFSSSQYIFSLLIDLGKRGDID